MAAICKHIIKILKGTIVKYDDHPIKLGQSIKISVTDNEFSLEPHEAVLDEDFENNCQYIEDEDDKRE